MRHLILHSLLAFGVVSASQSFAQELGLLYQLPKDGAWVQYQEKVGKEKVSTITLRSVGTATVAGKPCRWIEVERNWPAPVSRNEVAKFLIPEEYVGTEKPLTHAIQSYQREKDRPVTKLDQADKAISWVPMFLSGPTKDEKREPKTEPWKWKEGTLTCDVRVHQEIEDDPGKWKISYAHRVLTSDRVPFGVVVHRVDAKILEQKIAGAIILPFPMVMELVDIGDNAKSSLLEAK